MSQKFSKRQAYANDIAALRELLNDNPSAERLSRFQGFGALKELLLSPDDLTDWNKTDLTFQKEVNEVHDLLKARFGDRYKEALGNLRNSILSSFYTPDFVTKPVVSALRAEVGQVEEILEPSAGSGNFVRELRSEFPDAKITAIEKDWTTFEVLKSLHGNEECIHSGFENFKNRKFDLVVSNIPFGSVQVYDEAIYREAVPAKVKSTTRIHNYFFVKALDNAREGGVVAFVTSSGVMDSQSNKEIREFIVKNSDLVSAIRLPNTVFESAGTSPMTDLIVLRKHSGKKALSPAEKDFVVSEKIKLESEGQSFELDLNSYYKSHPQAALGNFVVGGQYGRDGLDMDPFADWSEEKISESIQTILAKDLKRLFAERAQVISIERTENKVEFREIPKSYPDRHLLKEGNLVVLGSTVGYAHYIDEKLYLRPEPAIKDAERTSALVNVRMAAVKLIDAELAGDKTLMTALRTELNSAYDQFIFQYGNICLNQNKKLTLFDAEGFKLISLEKQQEGKYVKADIFDKQVNNVERVYEKLDSLQDAVLLSLNATNRVDLDFIAEMTSSDPKNVLVHGLEQELLFAQFDETGKNFSWVPKDEFQSGNIVQKIELLAENRQRLPDLFTERHYQVHMDRLNEVRPEVLSRELIEINMGVRWVPVDVYEAFASELFKAETKVTYLGSEGRYLVEVKGGSNNESEITYAAKINSGTIDGAKLMEYAMIDTVPRLRIKVSDGPPVQYEPDVMGMKNAETKIKEIKNLFDKYTTNNKAVAERLEKIYNRDINNFVKRKYNGSHLSFEDLQGYKPHPYQKDCVWKIVQEDGCLADHVVGAGKSLTIAMAATKMKRLGIANKPLIICLKANVDQVAKHFQAAFPEAKILAPSEKDFTKERRKQIFSSISMNDWDAIVLTHDNFLRIPQNPHIVSSILNEEMNALESDLKVVKKDTALSKRVLKGLESRKENLKVKIKAHEAGIKRDDYVMNFDTMGIDHIFVDESQEFKNLAFTTRQQSVSGLGSPEGSQKARNLQYAIRTIQKKKGGDRGVTFASGTPISNSLVEMYLLKKYLRPNRLEKAGINSFDAWALMFAKKSTTYEFSITNEIKLKERYREFINLPELGMWYSNMAHLVTAGDLGENKPKLDHIMVNIEPTEYQKGYIEKLVHFTKTKDARVLGLPPLTEGEESAFMLLATNLAKKMSLDMRMIDPSYPFEEQGKIGAVCRVAAREWEDSSTFKGTQLIFCDMGTPSGASFNVYAELKRELTSRYQIPSEEIVFIHDFDTKTKKQQLTKLVNSGSVRFVIGSTKKLGTGNNFQERIIALHHLDLPWRPSDMDQRDGRGARQGAVMAMVHRNNTVKSYVYAVNRTLDAYQFNILSNKQKFIKQVKTTAKERRFDEGAMDQESGMNFAEYVALLSGNTDLLEKVKLEKKLGDVQRSYQAFLQQRSSADYQRSQLKKSLEGMEKSLAKLKADETLLNKIDFETVTITVGDKKLTDRKVVGEILLEKVKELDRLPMERINGRKEMASLETFKLIYERSFVSDRLFVLSASGTVYNYSEGRLNENPALAGRFIIDAIKRIPKVIENTEARIKESQERIGTYEKVLKEEFPNVGEIKKLEREIQELSDKIERKALEEKKSEVKEPSVSYKKPLGISI